MKDKKIIPQNLIFIMDVGKEQKRIEEYEKVGLNLGKRLNNKGQRAEFLFLSTLKNESEEILDLTNRALSFSDAVYLPAGLNYNQMDGIEFKARQMRNIKIFRYFQKGGCKDITKLN